MTPQTTANSVTTINSVRKLNWNRRRLRFGVAAIGSASIAALSFAIGRCSKAARPPLHGSRGNVLGVYRNARIQRFIAVCEPDRRAVSLVHSPLAFHDAFFGGRDDFNVANS